VTIAAGVTTATVTVDRRRIRTWSRTETVVLTVTSGAGYSVGTLAVGTGTIQNDDVPPVTVTVGVAPLGGAGGWDDELGVHFYAERGHQHALTVSFSVGGQQPTIRTIRRRSGELYGDGRKRHHLGGPDRSASNIDPTTDTAVEPDETVILTVVAERTMRGNAGGGERDDPE